MIPVAIIGMLAPYKGELGPAEVWGVSRCYEIQPDIKRLYNLDRLSWFRENVPDYIDRCNSGNFDVYMSKSYSSIEGCKRFPVEDVLKFFGFYNPNTPLHAQSGYFTSSIAWAWAHALSEGRKRIIIHGIQQDERATDYLSQKSCLDFLLGISMGRGVQVSISENSLIGKAHPWDHGLYGYVWNENYDAVCNVISSTMKACRKAYPTRLRASV